MNLCLPAVQKDRCSITQDIAGLQSKTENLEALIYIGQPLGKQVGHHRL